jgi:hypothetical protein
VSRARVLVYAARAFAACSALLLIGCGPSNRWRGDERFTSEQRAQIEAANVWEAERMGVEPIEIDWIHLDGQGERTILIAELPGNTGGDSGREDIRIDAVKSFDRIGVVFAHELGHVRGLHHHDGPGLMNVAVPAELEWEPADAEAWSLVR